MRGGGATRFMTLLTTPALPLRPSLCHLRRRITTATALNPITLPLSKPKLHHRKTTNLIVTASFHSQPNNNSSNSYYTPVNSQPGQHPWPEWTHFLNIVSSNNDGLGSSASQEQSSVSIPPMDAFVVYEVLPDDFVRASAKCLAFARARPELLGLLSRRDIEAVVSNGTPFLFKSAIDSAKRMRAFVGTDGNNVLESEKASMIDLMKYILSYASNPTVSSERKGLFSRELVDSSVRNLLHELSIVSSRAPSRGHVSSSDNQLSGRYGQTLKPFGPNIEMKRGDWICPKCNFMNFARNTKCLECDEFRPKRQLIGGEWECPQCNFNNYGRNSACLRCDCKKPGAPLFSNLSNISGSGYNGDYSSETRVESRLAEKEQWFDNIARLNAASENQKRISADSQQPNTKVGTINPREPESSDELQFPKEIMSQNKDREGTPKTENWFKKISELHNVKDPQDGASDDDFPEIMPMRKEESSKRKDGSFTSSKYNRQANTGQANNSNFVPFVPFPPGYFARKEAEAPINSPPESAFETSSNKSVAKTENLDDSRNRMASPSYIPSNNNEAKGSFNSRFSSNTGVDANTVVNSQPKSSPSSLNINKTSGGGYYGTDSIPSNVGYSGTENVPMDKNTNVQPSWSGTSLEGSAVKEPDPLDMSEEAKAERWFKRVAQIKDISELSQIPDEDFPSIMPMRKGVNRFVVSKRKTPLERRLTSQQYRRNLPIVSNNPIKKDSEDNNS